MIRLLLIIGAAIAIALVLRKYSEMNSGTATSQQSVPQTDEGVRELIQRRQKIAAIKLYRQLHKVGLKEAKKAVEQIERQQ